MTMSEKREDFQVVVEGLQLPKEVSKRLAAEIRLSVLKEIAKLDLKGDLVVKKLPKSQEFLKRIGPTEGLWTEYKEH